MYIAMIKEKKKVIYLREGNMTWEGYEGKLSEGTKGING